MSLPAEKCPNTLEYVPDRSLLEISQENMILGALGRDFALFLAPEVRRGRLRSDTSREFEYNASRSFGLI